MPSIGDLLRLYRVRAVKALAQNFLVDGNACRRLVRAAGPLRGVHVLEVGPGPGNLTRPILLQEPASLTLVERDTRMLDILLALRRSVDDLPMRIVAGDILLYDTTDSLPVTPVDWCEKMQTACIIGNLPFNISTCLLTRWLRLMSLREGVWSKGRVKMVLTFQKEVAERLAAEPGSRERCRLSVTAQNYCHVRHCFSISKRSFLPRPQVDVGVVSFVPRVQPFTEQFSVPYSVFDKVLRCLYNTKRKRLAGCVRNLYPPDERQRQLVTDTLLLAEVSDPDTVHVLYLGEREMARICQAYMHVCELYPHVADYDYRACKRAASQHPEDSDD